MLLKRLPILCSVLGLAVLVSAQRPVFPDSLVSAFGKMKTDRQKAEWLFELGDQLSVHDTVKSVEYIKEGLKYVSEDSYYEGIGYFYLGRTYMEFSRAKADSAFDTAILYLQQIPTHEAYIYQSRTWANKAVLAQLSGDNKTYIDLFLNKAIPLAAKGGDSLRMADGYTNVALPFMNYEEYDKAILYLDKSAALFARLAPNDLRQVDVYCHLAKIYLLQNDIDKAGKNIQLAAHVLKQDPESLYAPNYHTIESMYFIRRKMWTEAGQTIEKGLAAAEKLKNRYDVRQLLYQKAELFKAQQNWNASKEVLLKMYNEGYVDLITDRKQLFSDLSKIEQHLGNYKNAYDWMVKQAEVSEEVYAQQTRTQIADLEAKYNYVQKEKELLVTREKAKRQQAIVWITIFAFLITMVVVYFWFRNKRQRTARQIQQLKQQQRIELGKALLEGEERERSRLARDLHDGLGGMLAGIKLNLSQMIEAKKSLDRDDLSQTVDRLGHSVSELRRIARNMMPESLLQSGLVVALKDLCDEATLPGLKVSFRAFDIHEHFPAQVQVMIYRIVQELVYNAVKHSEASRIIVQCSQTDDMFFITVEDNGKGFSLNRVPDTSRGLHNIRSRVRLLNGKMDIDSSQEGTNINIELYVGQ